MTVDPEDRLTALFDRVADRVIVAEDLDGVRSIEPQRRRMWLPAVAAIVVLLAGVGAIVSVTTRDDPDRSVSQQPAAPAGPLYVLPGSPTGSTVGNGSMGSARVEPYRGIVVATPDGDGFVDSVAIQVSTKPRTTQRRRRPPTRSSRSRSSPACRGGTWCFQRSSISRGCSKRWAASRSPTTAR